VLILAVSGRASGGSRSIRFSLVDRTAIVLLGWAADDGAAYRRPPLSAPFRGTTDNLLAAKHVTQRACCQRTIGTPLSSS